MKKYSFYVLNRNGERTSETNDKATVMERLAEMLKYHYVYKSEQARKLVRTTNYRDERLTFYMSDGYKYVFEMPIN